MPRGGRGRMRWATVAAVLPAVLALVAVACTGGGPARRTASVRASSEPSVRGIMLATGAVFGSGLTMTRLPDGDARRLGVANDANVLDAGWIRPGRTGFA